MSLETGPVNNTGYYDVPICNQYSNKDDHTKPVYVNDSKLNTHIQLVLNNNKDSYLVNEKPTQPSESLFATNKINNNVLFENVSKYENHKDYIIYNNRPAYLENYDGYLNLRFGLENINVINVIILLLVLIIFILLITYSS
mgnify:FL=1